MNIRTQNTVVAVTFLAFTVGMLGIIPMQAAQQTVSLHDVVSRSDVATVRELLATETGRAQINQKGGLWGKPLHSAVYSGCETMVQLLLEYGAEVEAESSQGFTPLFLAVDKNNVTLAWILLESGADIHASTSLVGTTPLHWAMNSRDMALLLARYGADIDAENQNEESPLQLADQALQGALEQVNQERMKAICVWADRLHRKAGLPKALVKQLILKEMVFTDNQRRRFAALEAQ